ncbi:hypothetical protein NMG60_11014629 [Bertholletia excelsa]
MTMKRMRDEDPEAKPLAMANSGMLLSRAGYSSPAGSSRVFTCKKCNRQFPTFQALGGHCASHNKPRPVARDMLGGQSPAKPKLHVCSVCGLGFTTGQALGGHMRRHRAATGVVGQLAEVVKNGGGDGGVRVVCFDLNLTPCENNVKLAEESSFLVL